MSWRSPTESDLLEAISADELQGLREASLGEGQDDPIASHLAVVADEVRGYIAANRENTLGPDGTLPPRLIRACIDIAVLRIGGRVTGILFDPEGVRKKAAENALTLLRDVAAGRFAIERPDEAADSSQQNTMIGPAIAKPCRRFTDRTQDGI
jgi:hypothetical protein